MAAEYEKTRGVKLPPRHKGSVMKSSVAGGLTDKAGQSQMIAASAVQP